MAFIYKYLEYSIIDKIVIPVSIMTESLLGLSLVSRMLKKVV